MRWTTDMMAQTVEMFARFMPAETPGGRSDAMLQILVDLEPTRTGHSRALRVTSASRTTA